MVVEVEEAAETLWDVQFFFMGGDDDDDEVQKSSREREIANVKIPIKRRATTRNNTNPFGR